MSFDLFDPSGLAGPAQALLADLGTRAFWLSVLEIVWINILLSGDNAVVIAMACRGLPQRRRLWGMALGAGAAVVLRIVFTVVIARLLELPGIKLAGGLALLVIAARLVVPDEETQDVEAPDRLWRAVQIVVVADLVMSLDNVIAIAAAAQGSVALLVLGLAIGVPLIVAGAALIVGLLDRFPILVWAGAALLGWIGGGVIATDPLLDTALGIDPGSEGLALLDHAFAAGGAVLVLAAGWLWRRAKRGGRAAAGERAASDDSARNAAEGRPLPE